MTRAIESGKKTSSAARKAASPHDPRACIEPLLQSGEQLIWHAAGRSPHWPPASIFHAIFLSFWALALGYQLAMSALAGTIPTLMLLYISACVTCITIVLGGAIGHAVLSPGRDCYGLTNRRVIIVGRFLGRRERTFDAGNIKVLLTRGAAIGDIAFSNPNPRYVNRFWAIVGVDDPRGVADLIRTTLALEIPVKDARKPRERLYIPPPDPRPPY